MKALEEAKLTKEYISSLRPIKYGCPKPVKSATASKIRGKTAQNKRVKVKNGIIPTYLKWGSKYHNTPSQYKGRIYHSKFEAEYAMILDDMIKNKEILSWLPQVTLRLEVNKKLVCKYIADFWVFTTSGEEIHETKGYFTPIAKLKWKLAQAIYGKKYKFVLVK